MWSIVIGWVVLIFVFSLIIVIIALLHRAATEWTWRETLSVVLTTVSIIVGIRMAEKAEEYIDKDKDKTVTEEMLRGVEKNLINSMQASEKRLMASHAEIKSLLGALPDTSVSASMRDSLLAKIELLDEHIDRHFYRLDARFPSIDK